ncbi:hypothetical protein HY992_03955 [Candidatus Micrarchaeota archaeon]|nr:hypothetical protein [Candidatus Micrarchaeota archaeon]
MRDFLKVFFTCDGGVSMTVAKNKNGVYLVRKVFVSVVHPKMRDGLMDILERLSFSPKYYSDQIRLTTRQDIELFKKRINFLEGANVSNNSTRFSGLEKSYILDMIVKSYERPSEIISLISLPGFKSD